MDVTALLPVKDLLDGARSYVSKIIDDPRKYEPVYVNMERCKGLVVFVSMGARDITDLAAYSAINFHLCGDDGQSKKGHLEKVWLLHSPASEANAKELAKYLDEQNVKVERVDLDKNSDANDASIIKKKIDDIMANAKSYGLAEEEIAVDVTGGTVSVTMGIYSAKLMYPFQMAITLSDKVNSDGRVIPGSFLKPQKIEFRKRK